MLASVNRPRRLARWILAGLIVVHLLAFGAYTVHERQAHLVTMFLDARDQWRDGHLEVAAAEYQFFLARRPAIAWPIVLYRHFPDEAMGWYLLARVQTDRHLVDEALAGYERALSLDPRLGHREYRNLLLRSGRGAALIAFAQQEARADPAWPTAAKDLGAALLATGEPRRAVEAYERALALLPGWLARVDPGAPPGLSGEEADLLNLLAVAARRAGDVAGAERACGRAGATRPGVPRLDRLCAADAARAAGDFARAAQLLASYAPPAAEHEAIVAEILAPP